jgi:flagellar biosynthesis protein FliR
LDYRALAMAPDLISAVETALGALGVDLARVGAAWARATPLVVLVPAFGLRTLPLPARITMALAFAAAIFPAVTIHSSSALVPAAPLLVELVAGLPIAIATAVPLWAATMAGGLADTLRGSNEGSSFSVIEGRATPLAVLFSLGAAAVFFASGGPSRAAMALLEPHAGPSWANVAVQLHHGITLAVAVAAPVLAASIVLEVATALIARAGSPAHVDTIVAPVKSLTLLVIVALALDRMMTVLR